VERMAVDLADHLNRTEDAALTSADVDSVTV
jgi:hypothetical protein